MYPSSVEVDCGCIALVEVVLVERGVRYFRLYKSSSVEVPSVGVLGGQVSGLEILLGEGGDVELGARTLEHILLFVFGRLTLYSLSLFICVVHHSYHPYHIYMLVLCLALIHIAYPYMLGCVCLCASLVPNHESFI